MVAFAQNWDILQTRMDQRGDHIKMNFGYFQTKKWMLQAVRAEKVDEKNGVIFLVSMFPSWVMICKLSKKVHFLQFCADLSKKSSHYTLSENTMIYRGLSHRSRDIGH